MKPGGRRVILGVLAVLVIVLGIIVLAFMPREDPREAKARRLLAELRADRPGPMSQLLIKLDLVEPPPKRDAGDILDDLVRLGSGGLPVVIRGLSDKSPSVRYFSALTIASMGPQARESTPHLLSALEDTDISVRFAAAEALGRIGCADIAVPFLVRSLQSSDALERYRAARALGSIGPAAEEIIPVLQDVLKDDNGGVRYAAEAALDNIQTAAATRVTVPQNAVAAQVDSIMDAVERAESLRGPIESYDYDAVGKRLRDVVGKINDPVVLEKVFYICERRLRQMPNLQGDLRAGSHYWLAQEAIVVRIGRLPGTRSAKILVDLLRDETLSWDGGAALTIGGAITERGKDCLPYLLKIPEKHEQKRFASELVEHIRKGKVFGP